MTVLRQDADRFRPPVHLVAGVVAAAAVQMSGTGMARRGSDGSVRGSRSPAVADSGPSVVGKAVAVRPCRRMALAGEDRHQAGGHQEVCPPRLPLPALGVHNACGALEGKKIRR